MPTATVTPAAPKQIETVLRLARAVGQEVSTDGLTRAQASELISSFIGAMDQQRTERTPAVAARKAQEPAVAVADNPFPEDPDVWGADGGLTDGDPLGELDAEEDDEEINLARSIPEGMGLFEITGRTINRQTASGFPNIRVRLQAIGGEGDGLDFLENVSLSPAARFRLNPFLDAIRAPQSGKMGTKQWVGRRMYAIVKHEEYEGRIQPRVDQWVTGPDDPNEGRTPEADAQGGPSAQLGAEFR